MNEIMVSVVVATYNQEGYIKQAIESIVMQKVNFEYEVLIGEDCSTDRTREVLESLRPSLPENFRFYFREKNMGGKGSNNFKDLYSRAVGKYIIVLEGDDYWLYDLKLQKQVDFLESHLEYMAVGHDVIVVDKNGNENKDYVYPSCRHFEYSFDDYRNGILAGQTATLMRRNPIYVKTYKDYVQTVDYPGDQKNSFIYLCNGKVACLQEKWSAYRYVTEEGSSYSAMVRYDKEVNSRKMDFFKEMYDFIQENFEKKSEPRKCVQSIYIASLFNNLFRKVSPKYSFSDFIRSFVHADFKWDAFRYILRKAVISMRRKEG